jgi:hypothetical protein
MLIQNSSFARLSPKFPSPALFSAIGCGVMRQDDLPASLFAIFHTSSLLLVLKVKSELASCLLTQGTVKKSS